MGFFGAMLLCCSLLLSSRPSFQAKCYEKLSKQDLPNCLQLADNYVLSWSLKDNSVTYGIEIDQDSGWFALGLSEGGGMKGADVWIFRKDSTGNWTVKDGFSTDYVTPSEDQQQDVVIASVQQSTGSTAIVFTRKLDTCDYERDNVVYPTKSQPYIFAHGADWEYHGTQNRGTMFLVLDRSDSAVVANSAVDEVKQLPLHMSNITIPPARTSYICEGFQLPTDNRFHIIEVDYTITPSKMVHHMLLFACSRKPDKMMLSECYGPPPECSYLYFIWVPGQHKEILHPLTGFPFGKRSIQYMMIQAHYNNPDGRVGVKDASGFDIVYTPKLRPNDMGVLWLGDEDFKIPPGQQEYALPPNICPSECTSKFTADLNMDMSDFHMHLLGSRQTVQHLQPQGNGSMLQLTPPNFRNYYDFSWQGGTFILPGAEKLVRGDAFITTCTYNSVMQKNVTLHGVGSNNEMCYNFVRYWPAQKIDRCISYPIVSGKGYAQCTSLEELFSYIIKTNMTMDSGLLNPDHILDLQKAGLVVEFDANKYTDIPQYNRLAASASCTARQVDNTTTTPAPKPASATSRMPCPMMGMLLFVGFWTAML